MIEDSYILEDYTGEGVKETLGQVSENTANIESLETSLNNEVANRITGDAALDSKIAGEKKQRELADDALRDSISAEETERKNADNALSTAIDNERNDRKAADDALQEAIDGEVSEREAAVRMLKQELDAEVLGRKRADDTMEAEVRELADEVTQADKELLDRMQGVSDNSNPYTDPFVLVRFAGDGFLEQFNTWLDDLHTVTSVADARKAGFFRVNLYGSFCEVKNIVLSWTAMKFQQIVEGNVYIDGQGKVALNGNRYTILQRRYYGSAWSEWQEDAYEIRKTIANDLRTGYSGNDVSLSLYRGQSRLFGNAINAATEERAGVMSAEDKIEQRNIRTLVETFKKNLIPSGLTVSCLERITLGNIEPIYIKAELFPETVYRNIIYISDNKAVTVGTDGRVTPVSVGKSVISVIPTCNTSLAKTIIVEVGKPLARLVNNRATLRLTSSGAFRLT